MNNKNLAKKIEIGQIKYIEPNNCFEVTTDFLNNISDGIAFYYDNKQSRFTDFGETTYEFEVLGKKIDDYQNKFPKMFADRNIRYDEESKEITYNAEFNNENCIVYLQALINTYAVLRLD